MVATDPDARLLRLSVRDDGPGLPDPNGGAGRAALSKPGGTGVGLPVVRGLVEGSGGSLSLTRGESGGTTATISLPLRPAG
jgi:two-component system nitrogen regulation sensor histidine kinase GlnL